MNEQSLPALLRAFITVSIRSFVNRIVSRARRLREPRYLIGFIMGLVYFWFTAARHWFTGRAKTTALLSGTFNDVRIDAFSLILLVILLGAWALPGSSGGLEFTEAEVAFLFPAPLKRWHLLLYKIIRTQPQVLLSVLVMTFFGVTRGKVIGLWVAFSGLALYFTFVALGRARLRLLGINFWVRLLIVIALLAGIAFAVAHTIDPHAVLAQLKPAASRDARLAALDSPFHTPLLRTILFVPRIYVLAIFPPTLWTLLFAALAVLALDVIWFVSAARVNVSFEEASLVVSRLREEKRAARMQHMPGSYVMFKRAKPIFRLRESGPPEAAIVWKNSIAFMRMSVAWAALFLAIAGFLFVMGLVSDRDIREGWTLSLLLLSATFPLFATNLFRNDLRLDLPKLEILKSYPISGERLLRGEIASPLVIVAGLEMVYLLMAAILARMTSPKTGIAFASSPQFVTIALLLVIPICALQLVIRNAIPVFFPAWVSRSKEDGRGFVQMGQRLVVLIGNLFVLLIALLPAALFFIPFVILGYHFFLDSPLFVALATVPAVSVVVLEVWFGTKLLGGQFDRIDASTEIDTAMT